MVPSNLSVEEVIDFLRARETIYRRCLELIKLRFSEFMLSPDGDGKVYNIYSRGERQRGNEFKECWKIADEVNEKRSKESTDDNGPPERVSARPCFPIQDVDDIIGLTVVCVYPFDMEAVINFVEDQVKQNKLIKFCGKRKQERGYHAYHFVLGSCDPIYSGIKCEVQIKTLLHDAWTAKTHELCYKPKGELDERLRKQMEVLGDTLAAIDTQSELIGSMIREKWSVDVRRKEAARYALLLALKHGEPPADKKRVKAYGKILEDLEKNETAYRKNDYTSVEVTDILRKIDKFVGAVGHDFYSCRMLAILASMRPKKDLDNLALDALDRWIATLSRPADKVDALGLKGLVLFCFGQVEAAIQVTEEVLRLAEHHSVKEWIAKAKGNLAYFLADLEDSQAGKKLRAATRARKYVKEALADMPTNKKLQDTLGTVMISFGKTPEEVRQGLEICRKAYDEAEEPEKAVAGLFFEIHERRAYRRIIKWD